MRKYIALGILFLIVPGALAASQPNILVENVDPGPAAPGDMVTVHLVAQNNGDTEASYEPLDVQTSDGVKLVGQTSLDEDFTLCAGCQKTAKLYFKVSEDATSGSYPVELHMTNGHTGIIENLMIEVDGEPRIIVNSGKISIPQGGETSFTLRARNVGTDTASELVAELSHPELTFSNSEISLGTVKPGASVESNVSVSTSEKLPSGPLSIKTVFDYRDEQERRSSESRLSANVEKDAQLAVSSIEKNNIYRGSKSRILVEFENLGPGEAEKIKSTLTCSGAEVIDAENFVGSLEDGESIPTVYTILPGEEQVECRVQADYSDAGRETLEESFTVTSNGGSRQFLPYAALALVLAGAVYYWKKRDEE